jgi:hypothetical protein
MCPPTEWLGPAPRTFQRLATASKAKGGISTEKKWPHLKRPSLAAIQAPNDTAITAASNDPTVPDRHVDLLASHSTGINERYVVPEAVRMACEAAERAYSPATR